MLESKQLHGAGAAAGGLLAAKGELREMEAEFPQGRPLFIGSLPMRDHPGALREVLARTPETPHWVQLPANPKEGFLVQFCEGLPGLRDGTAPFIESGSDAFQGEILAFYEEYLKVTEGHLDLERSRFKVSAEAAPGLHLLVEAIRGRKTFVVKGQTSGPLSVLLGIRDEAGRSAYYDERLRDAAVKLLSLKARWQALFLGQGGRRAMVFVDEPAMGALGSSVYIGVDQQEALACLGEVLRSVRQAGAWSGLHVCSNADWGVLLSQELDVMSFDAFSYFERVALFSEKVAAFLRAGGMLAWGIVPTTPEALEGVEASQLVSMWLDQAEGLSRGGLSVEKILRQAFITPSCGLGGLHQQLAAKAMDLTVEVSRLLRRKLAP